MNPALKPYPEYRRSQLPWIGQLPDHWQLQRAKHVFRCVDVRSTTGEGELLTVSSRDGVVPRREKQVTMFMARSYVGHKLCWPGDLVINSLWAWAQGLGFARQHGIVSSAYGVYRPLGRFADGWPYLDALLRSAPYQWEFQVRSKGIWVSRLQLTDEAFLDMPVLLPPLPEQQQIAAFLAHFDRRVNRLIRAKRRMIELLEEQKQAIIQQAVTRGLDPSVPMKASGVEWLGEVPAHWEVWKIGHLARVGNGSTPSRANGSYWSGGSYPWLNSSCVNLGVVTAAKQYVTDLALRECHLPKVPPGSVLVAITGQGKTRGKCALLAAEATINQHLAFISARNDRVSSAYMTACLGVAYTQLRAISDDSGSTKGALTCADIRHFRVPLPPRVEQDAIVACLDEALAGADVAISSARREIDLLREYRTRLVADVVTGKLDVRGIDLGPLDEPEEPDDIEPGDDFEPEDVGDTEEQDDADD